jgi:hypothetical protein
MSIWISPGAIEIAGDRKARVQVPVQLEGRKVWASGNQAYEPLLVNFSALVVLGWVGHK